MTDDIVLDKEGFITIDSIDFFGRYKNCRSGVYTIAWADYSQEPRLGKYVLLERKKIILQGYLKRPNDGKVADNGNFILNDWLFGEGLKGDFFAFDRSGEPLATRSYSANLLNNGLSVDGNYAVCQAAMSHTTDNSVLSFFDLIKGQLVWEKIPITRQADHYFFDTEKCILQLIYKGIGRFRYSFTGEFLDHDRWEEARIQHGTGFDLFNIALEKLRDLGNELTTEGTQEIIRILDMSLLRLSSFPYQLAKVHRTLGEIYEELGQLELAVMNYETALSFYPKIGVQKKTRYLKENLRR